MHWPFIPLDTSVEAFRVQVDVLRKMTPEHRWRKVFEMYESARILAANGVRHRHPEYNQRQVKLAVIRLFLGDDLFKLAFPEENVAV